MLTEDDMYLFLDCFEIDAFFRKILLYNIKKNKIFVLDNLVDLTLSNDMSVIKKKRLDIVINFLKRMELNVEVYDVSKLGQAINKLEYCMQIIGEFEG